MDYARSAYSRIVRYEFHDRSKTWPIIWYTPPPTAVDFPFLNNFVSANWDEVRGLDCDLGDVATSKAIWVPGKNQNNTLGQHWAGRVGCFFGGALPTDKLQRRVDNVPVECKPLQYSYQWAASSHDFEYAQGQGLLAGRSLGTASGTACANCPGRTPLTVRVTTSGFVVPNTYANKQWVLTQTGPCTWEVTEGIWHLVLTRTANHWHLDVNDIPIPKAKYDADWPTCFDVVKGIRTFHSVPCATSCYFDPQ